MSIFHPRVLVSVAFLAAVIAWAKYDSLFHGYDHVPISSSMAIILAYWIGYGMGVRKQQGTEAQTLLAWYMVPILTLLAFVAGVIIERSRGAISWSSVAFHTSFGLIIGLLHAIQASLTRKYFPDKRSMFQRLSDES